MNYEKTINKVLQWSIILIGIFVVFIRCCVQDEYVNICMTIVNFSSFGVSINILLMDLYSRFKKIYRKNIKKNNIVKIKKMQGIAIFSYLSIFAFNLVYLIWIIYFCIFKKGDVMLCNDVLGIISLIVSISGDVLNSIVVACVLCFV